MMFADYGEERYRMSGTQEEIEKVLAEFDQNKIKYKLLTEIQRVHNFYTVLFEVEKVKEPG